MTTRQNTLEPGRTEASLFLDALLAAGVVLSDTQQATIRDANTISAAAEFARSFGVEGAAISAAMTEIGREPEGQPGAGTSFGQLVSLVQNADISAEQIDSALGALSAEASLVDNFKAVLDAGVPPRAVALVSVGVDGGEAAFVEAGGQAAAGNIDVFTGTEPANVQISVDGGPLNVANIAGLDSVRGPGLVRLAMTKEQGNLQGIEEGPHDILIVNPDESRLTYSGTLVFFSDSDQNEMAQAALDAGTLLPSEVELDEEGNVVGVDTEDAERDAIFEEFAGLGIPGQDPFLGTQESVTLPGYHPYQPARTVAPVFRQSDPAKMFMDMAPDERADWQDRFEAAGLADPGSADTMLNGGNGGWSDYWTGVARFAMTYSNLHGYASSDDDRAKLSALGATLVEFGNRPPQPIPAFVPSTREVPTGAELEARVRNVFQSKLGQDPTPGQMAEFSRFLQDQYGESFAAQEQAAERDFVLQQQATGQAASPAQEQLLSQDMVEVPNPVAEMEKFFLEQFGGKIEQREQFAQSRESDASLMDSVSLMRRMSGG